MFTMLAVLVYLAAIALPLFVLYHYGSSSWYWHVLAILAALGIGLAPTPPSIQSPASDLLMGFFLVGLMIWGIGGIVIYRPHVHKHA